MWLKLSKTGYPTAERAKAKEISIAAKAIVSYSKTEFKSESEIIRLYLIGGNYLELASFDWNKDSWERFVCDLENCFAEPETVYASTHSLKPNSSNVNYYY